MNKYYVEKIAARYFIVSDRTFKHLAECLVRKKKKRVCTCGLIHDLGWLDHPFASILHPDFSKELRFQNPGFVGGRQLWLKNTFGKDQRADLRDIKKTYDEFKTVVKFLFPRKTDCPAVYKRLQDWLEHELAKPL